MRTPACHTPEKRLSGERTRRVKHEWKQDQVEPLGTMSQLWSRSIFEAALEDKLHYINVGSGVLMLSFATFWCTRINLAESCNRLHQATARGLDIVHLLHSLQGASLPSQWNWPGETCATASLLWPLSQSNWMLVRLKITPLTPRDILDPAFDSVKLLVVEGFCQKQCAKVGSTIFNAQSTVRLPLRVEWLLHCAAQTLEINMRHEMSSNSCKKQQRIINQMNLFEDIWRYFKGVIPTVLGGSCLHNEKNAARMRCHRVDTEASVKMASNFPRMILVLIFSFSYSRYC